MPEETQDTTVPIAGESTTSEPTEETPATEEPTGIDGVMANVDKQLEEASRAEDPIDEYGVDATVATESDKASAGDEKTSWKQKALDLEEQLKASQTRSQVTEVVAKVEKDYPDAYKPTVQRAIRGGASPDNIERIAKASHMDFQRGKKQALEGLKSELSAIKENAANEAKQEVKTAWGQNTPAGGHATGGKKMSPAEFSTWMKNKSSAQIEDAMRNRVQWGEDNVAGQQLSKL